MLNKLICKIFINKMIKSVYMKTIFFSLQPPSGSYGGGAFFVKNMIKHLQSNELLILWTAGVKKIQIVNILFYSSVITLIIYLFFS